MDHKWTISSLMGSPDHGSGSGSALNPVILITAGICAFSATFLASFSIWLQLKNYRRPILQRQVVRIMLMIPLYAMSSFISLFSLEAAVVIDALRDVYEAFVIYNFFHLLLDYLGGERSLLILLHGRPAKHHIFPVSLFKSEIDVSDPFTFLFLKRGILQYVQIKPVLAVVTLILKATDNYKEGDLRADAGYLYVSIVYNISIFVALYCLAVFWIVINDDVKPFRPMPKFLCIKGILFFCFWQTITVSILVSPLRLITHIGPYTDVEHISIAISDVLICYEMPFFAVAHMYAFSHKDYIDPLTHYAARLRFWYATRDAFGLRDVVEDSKATLHATVNYRTYEPVEGGMHVGVGRDRRIRAGLRYTKGGQQKYWLPMPADEQLVAPAATGPLSALQRRWNNYQGYAPITAEQSEQVVHEGFQEPSPDGTSSPIDPFQVDYNATEEDGLDLHFEPPSDDRQLEAMYEESRRLVFGDYNYPVIDVSTEAARIEMWDEEERILSNERSAAWSWKGGKRKTLAYSAKGTRGYGATEEAPRASTSNAQTRASFPGSSPHPAIIDHSSDVAPNFDIKGIQLHWAKTGAAVPKRSGSSQGDRRKGPDTPTRLESRTAKGEPQPEHVPDPDEPPELVDQRDDAVDLVVEDRKAGQLEMEWERRRGEPALEGESGLKKVYRRKYDIDDDEEMEIDEARNPAQKPHERPEKLRVNVKEGRNSRGVPSPMNPDASSSLGPSSPWTHDNKLGATQRIVSPGSDTDMVISRETQPPRNAQLDGNKSQRRFDDEDSNPWG